MKSFALLLTPAIVFALLLTGCPSLKEGECKRDSHCDDMATKKGELWICYKEPVDAEMGKCMRAKDARGAAERYKRKLTGKCVDADGDGVKAGDACDPPVDCNDADKAVKPGAAEICDMKDNDCDGLINEGLTRCVGTVLGGKVDPVVQFMVTLVSGVEVAPNGEIWAADQHQIYKIDAKHKAARFAGSNKPGLEDKKGKFARFDQPRGLAVDVSGNLYVADCNNNCIRRVSPDGQVKVYAGKCSREADDTGLDEVGDKETARFWCPIDVIFDTDGSLLVADMLNSKIKRITKAGKVEHFAGLGGKEDENGYTVFGNANGSALKAEFNQPAGIALAPDGGLVIADTKNNCIRKLANGKVTTLAGICDGDKEKDKGGYADGKASEAKFKIPQSVDVDKDGVVYVADTGNHCIRMIKAGKVSTLTGKPGQQGYYDGSLDEALFNEPWTVSVAKDGSIYVVDYGNYRIRRVAP
jgi:DNA-binding beta-propeller fold protein YncE